MRTRVANLGITIDDLRAELERVGPDNPKAAWLMLAMPYAEGVSIKDFGFVADLAEESSATTAMAALHTLSSLRYAFPEEARTAFSEAVGHFLSQLSNTYSEDHPSLLTGRLALSLAQVIGGPGQAERLAALARNPNAPNDLRAEALGLLARAGGAGGAQTVLAAFVTQQPGSIDALRSIRSPSAAGELQALADRSLASAEDTDVCSAAFGGLIASDPDAALAFFREDLVPRYEQADGEQRQRMSNLIAEVVAGMQDPRDAGPFRLFWFQLTDSEATPLNGLPENWREAFEKSNTMPRSWIYPSGRRQDEVCESLLWALEKLPKDSSAYSGILGTLIRMGREQDLLVVEKALERRADFVMEDSLARRHEDDRLGRVSLWR